VACGLPGVRYQPAPLGEPGTTENPPPGEVIYTAGVLTRHWNHRDAERTKVTEISEQIVFLPETVDAAAFGTRLDDATGCLAGLPVGRRIASGVYRHLRGVC